MKRDIELIRKILFKIEAEIDNLAKFNLAVEGYSMEAVGYHCAILYEGGYIHSYNPQCTGDGLYAFGVSRLTWEGHDLLDKIREESVWNKTKDVIKDKALPNILEVVKSVSSSVISSVVEGAVRAGMNN